MVILFLISKIIVILSDLQNNGNYISDLQNVGNSMSDIQNNGNSISALKK